MMSHSKIAGAVLVAALFGFAACPAAADPSGDKAAAQVLFDEGRRLMGEGKLTEACPKLAESQRLDPGVGTQFNLSDCYERMGRTASAWAGFLEVAAAARAAGQSDREQVARERAAALEPRLSKLTLTVPPSTAALVGLEVKRDGEALGSALFGVAVPVDPGRHKVVATAPGRAAFSTEVEVKPERDAVVVTIPELAPAPAPASASAASASSAAGVSSPGGAGPGPGAASAGTTGSAPSRVSANGGGAAPASGPARDSAPSSETGAQQRRLALWLTAAGAVGLGVGTVFLLKAKSQYNDSLSGCEHDNPNLCNQQGFSKRQDARSSGNIATVTYGIGLAALAVAGFEWLTAPSAAASTAGSTPARARPFDVGGMVGPGGSSITVQGVF